MRGISTIMILVFTLFLAGPFLAEALGEMDNPCNKAQDVNLLLDLGPVNSTITISGTGLLVNEDFSVDISTNHMDPTAIAVILQSPSNTNVLLWSGNAGPSPFEGNFPNTLVPLNSLDVLLGEPLDGDWKLFVNTRVIRRVDAEAPLLIGNFLPTWLSWGVNGCPVKPVVIPGDCDGNGNVDMADYRCLRVKIGAEPGDADWAEGADVDGDGKIWYDDLRDLIRLIRK